MINIGKQFEYEFSRQCKLEPNVNTTRLYDITSFSQNAYDLENAASNPCDFILYRYPNAFYFELKATKGKLFQFSNIRKNQFDGLMGYSGIDGAFVGILLWFYEHKLTFFIDIREIDKIKKCGRKSINIEMCHELGTLFDGRHKTKYTDYYILKNLDKISK